jgi:hypothetical protein
MTWVPHDASVVLPPETPKAGGTGKVDAAARYLGETVEDAGQFQVSVRGAQRELIGMKSAAVQKIGAKLGERLIPGAQTLQRSASSAKAAFETYAAEVSRINGDADGVVSSINEALGVIRGSAGKIEEIAERIRSYVSYAWNEVPPGVMPDPVLGSGAKDLTAAQESAAVATLRSMYEYEWLVAASSWHAALDTVNAALRSWLQLIEDRKLAEGALVQALERTDLGQLIALHGGPEKMPQFTIAATVAGELWGEEAEDLMLAKDHPLLKGLIGSESGEHVFDVPPDPDGVAAKWSKLSDGEKARLIDEVPWVIGNLPGLPYDVRDQANRKLLEYYVLHGDEMTATCNTALDEVLIAMSKDNGRPPVSIVALNFEGPVPKVAMGYGDLDAAKNVTWEVPGMFSDASAALPGWDRASKNVYAEQLTVLDRAGRKEEGNAVIAFLEYDTPDLVTVLAPGSAREGAQRFAAELDGTVATRNHNVPLPNLAVIAHSYGTTTAANALTLVNHSVQSFTMLGSAGLDGETVEQFSDLKVDSDANGVQKIYTSMASKDMTAPFGSGLSNRLQPNPERALFDPTIDGAKQFSSDGEGDFKATTGHDTLNAEGGGYFDKDTQSLWNSAAVSVGEIFKVVGQVEVASTDIWQIVGRQFLMNMGSV